MSTTHEYDCSRVAISSDTVYMIGIDGGQFTFKYNIGCTADMDIKKIKFFFNIKTNLMLMVMNAQSYQKIYGVNNLFHHPTY